MAFEFNGKRVVVTGASSGIGRATALRLADYGASVLAVGRDQVKLEEVFSQARALTGEVVTFAADLTDPESIAVVAQQARQWGDIAGLVNAAGGLAERVDYRRPAEFARQNSTAEIFDYTFALNTRAPALMSYALQEELRASGQGAIVNVSSSAALTAPALAPYYSASKAALATLTRSLAKQFSPDIRVNTVTPGHTDTPGFASDPAINAAEAQKSLLGQRIGRVDEVVAPIPFLLDPASSGWITGSDITVNGGATA
ncbi:hypothetical protein BKG84_10890 [Mycobacteroides chelonae]|uniref:Short-chain dehydrogenase n=2 Tax=Mycobacteroides chelonae TaxID=1774 RepID=A0A1S1M7Q8_MYCCH|nr:hypothetical protein BKG84_10890 [Mycobacteroides chelonae]